MSRLWKWIKRKDISDDGKVGIFLFLNSLTYCILGFLTWLVVSRFALDTWDWALCFIGYPGFFIGYIGGIIFLCQQ